MEFCSILGFQNAAGNVGYWWRLPACRPGQYREPRLGTGNTAATQARYWPLHQTEVSQLRRTKIV